MSEFITADNLDLVIQRNREIKDEVYAQAWHFQTNPSFMKFTSTPQLALLILQGVGLVQLPVEDKYLSGAIYVKEGKTIPFLNTALPRANQYFTAWHEVYHLVFDRVSLDHFIGTEQRLEERKAEYFAACMLLNGVERYFTELPAMDFLSKVFWCMSAFQAPYKAVLVTLYEYAIKSDNEKLRDRIKAVFDMPMDDIAERFQSIGLDDSLVRPSYVVNTAVLQAKITMSKDMYPDLNYHRENEMYLGNIMSEIKVMMRGRE